MAGKAPKFISIEDHPSLNAHEWHEWDDSPVVCIAKDDLHTLDLRFAIGLTVFHTSLDERRAKAIHQKLIEAKAQIVSSCVLLPGEPAFRQTGWSQLHIGK
jgi:hypothetical protein